MTDTAISWTDKTWNPIAGCQVVSPGCRNCYAMKMAVRLEAMGQQKYAGLAEVRNGHTVWTGRINLDEDALALPYKWRKPCMVFVNSMSDLFHEDVPYEFIDRVMKAVHDNPRHTFQILTKRGNRMADYISRRNTDVPGVVGIPANIWFGVSAEDHERARGRIPFLGAVPRRNPTFVSYEPALGPIDWRAEWRGIISQIIVGAESGANRRPFDMAWARATRDFCLEHGIAFFMKQGSAYKSGVNPWLVEEDGRRWQWHQYPGNLTLPEEVVA
jgi:protein gp37